MTGARDLEQLLRAACVRVEGGPLAGTGFFVAPGRVVACVHVTGRDEEIALAVRRDGAPPLPATWRVLACDGGRPLPKLAEDYPDVAILDVEPDGHPCVLLDRDWPRDGDEFRAFGFPSEGGAVPLAPLLLEYGGRYGPDATPFVDLSSRAPVREGMSGGPLLSLRTAAVCGLLVATHSQRSAHGGLAVAWSALPADVLAELLDANARFHAADARWRDAAVRRRRTLVYGRARAVEHFTGREVEMGVLERRLAAGGRAIVTQAITGLGGVGKTQLAARYVECHRAEFDVVAWVRAEDGGVADLAGLGSALGVAVGELTPDERAAAALELLERCDERWLLVLDNVGTPEQLQTCAPKGGNGCVLVTTRNRDLGQLGQMLSIDVFGDDDAADCLIARTGRDGERAAALALGRALGGLPLALAHAGAYCAELTDFATYAGLLADLPPRELYDRSPEIFYEQTVASTWHVAIDAAADPGTGDPLARDVLALAAHLAPDDVWLKLLDVLLDAPGDAGRRKRLLDAVRALHRYSLVDLAGGALGVHRLLQRVVRTGDRDVDKPALARAGPAALAALTGAMPGDQALPEHWPRWERLLPHAVALADALAEPGDDAPALVALLNRCCVYLHHLGTFERSTETAGMTVGVAERVLGDEHPSTLSARANLASSYRQAGRTGDAIVLGERVLVDRERVLGDEHPDTLGARGNLAASYWQAGRTGDAIALLRQAVDAAPGVLGADHPDTVAMRAMLAGWTSGGEDGPDEGGQR